MFITTLLLIIILLTFVLGIYHYCTGGRKYWEKRNVAYREPCPIFGNFGATLTMRKNYAYSQLALYNQFRSKKYVGIFQARRPTLMIIDLEIVKNIFTKEFPCFSDRISSNTDTKREPLLRNLANMSGSEWKSMRHIVTPTFSSGKMKAMFPLVAECAEKLKTVLLQLNTLEEEIDVPDVMSRFTTDVIGSCAFGFNPGSLENPDSPFLKMAKKGLEPSRSRILKRYIRTFFPWLFRMLNLASYSREVEVFFTTIIKQVLDERRNTGLVRNDFLQLMLNVQNTQPSDFEMTDELITSNSYIFMLAGLETSACTLSFCLYHLAKDKELQDRLRNEIKDNLRRFGELNYDAAISMKLVLQTMFEGLRLHPPTPLTTRLCTSPCTLPGTDLQLKVKENVLIPISCIQRDPAHFPDPDKFDPERFANDCHPPGFMAFGDGPRSCPGKKLFYSCLFKNNIQINYKTP